jgi:hypothetical protein
LGWWSYKPDRRALYRQDAGFIEGRLIVELKAVREIANATCRPNHWLPCFIQDGEWPANKLRSAKTPDK